MNALCVPGVLATSPREQTACHAGRFESRKEKMQVSVGPGVPVTSSREQAQCHFGRCGPNNLTCLFWDVVPATSLREQARCHLRRCELDKFKLKIVVGSWDPGHKPQGASGV